MKTLSFTAIALVGAMSMSEAAINFTAVGEYDAAGANTVDASATALNVSTFTGMVQTAFNSGTGGVINFDNRTGDSTGSAWGVSYNGGAGTLNFTLGVSAVAFQSAAIDATPISGSGYFRLTGTSTAGARVSNQMTFAAGSYLSSFGFTFLARNAAIADVYITGTYNDDTPFVLYNSASPFSNAAVSSPGNSATPDTFIGFTATDGKAIKTLNINLPANTFPVIDDFGFIVSPIPEPSAALLSLAGVAALASRRRRA
ncbi:MAG TPA: PEP-CTERM sorting domain-containing protein [Luteolibacter sp.]|jgi:MYXO-CTERM domain-containing protein|nr:PEP-CTERM sorting domain-containing protein [Luteolibacter sp.]